MKRGIIKSKNCQLSYLQLAKYTIKDWRLRLVNGCTLCGGKGKMSRLVLSKDEKSLTVESVVCPICNGSGKVTDLRFLDG